MIRRMAGPLLDWGIREKLELLTLNCLMFEMGWMKK
jgi:hypothetical protein